MDEEIKGIHRASCKYNNMAEWDLLKHVLLKKSQTLTRILTKCFSLNMVLAFFGYLQFKAIHHFLAQYSGSSFSVSSMQAERRFNIVSQHPF